jgi:hypothetical protein
MATVVRCIESVEYHLTLDELYGTENVTERGVDRRSGYSPHMCSSSSQTRQNQDQAQTMLGISMENQETCRLDMGKTGEWFD